MYIFMNYYRLRMTNDRPNLWPERAPPQRQDSNFQTTFGQKVIAGHKSQSRLDISITD
jgi:hypothetical protein